MDALKNKKGSVLSPPNIGKEVKSSLYKPAAAKKMGNFRYDLWGKVDGVRSYQLLMVKISQYRRSLDQPFPTPKYIYTSIKVLKEFLKNINFAGSCDLMFEHYENPQYRTFNPYISQVAKRLGLSLTTVKYHFKVLKEIGVLEVEAIEGKRSKLKRLNPAFLDALGMLSRYNKISEETREERSGLMNSYRKMMQSVKKAAEYILPQGTPLPDSSMNFLPGPINTEPVF